MWFQKIAVQLSFVVLMSFSASLADTGSTKTNNKRNPFVHDFLPICGQLAISGTQSRIWYSKLAKTLAAGSPLEIKIKNDIAACSLVKSYSSNVSDIGQARRQKLQPWWLKDISHIESAFDSWIRANRSVAHLRAASNCERKRGRTGPVDEVLYSRSVSVGNSRRIILVQITRSAHSYLEPDRGHSTTLTALAINGPADCV